ncbi:anti-sigma factor [Pedobacter montanisoli]|uniref:Zf-HC2 domain-containing protein n=1 Tax=Pedobacter montanisoli TaxID=2923277 RepID=A0ABS9ZU18_9SPHI|nr:hypothetical protein [Pedobacter montanisoli]MCJ0741808.1 hypothetical protein [Pedobacter montanisoli]
MEEKIWSYIDGALPADERAEVEILLQTDSKAAMLYEELLKLNEELKGMELEEPSMSFLRNVMEEVNEQTLPAPLKTKLDTRIIYGIAAFFVLVISGWLIYGVLSSPSASEDTTPLFSMNFDFSKLNSVFLNVVICTVSLALAGLILSFIDGKLKQNMTQKKGS